MTNQTAEGNRKDTEDERYRIFGCLSKAVLLVDIQFPFVKPRVPSGPRGERRIPQADSSIRRFSIRLFKLKKNGKNVNWKEFRPEW